MENHEAWLRLWRTRGIGCRSYNKLLAHFGEPANVLSASLTALKQAGLTQTQADAIRSQKGNVAWQDLRWLEDDDHHLVTFSDPGYPQRLRDIADPPPLLYVHGDVSLLRDPQIAMVGSRNPTPPGDQNAFDFARHFASIGMCVTSGLALGIDGASHRGALAAEGVTIAVTATGLDRVYPAQHRKLAHKISERGALVCENPIGTPPRAQSFPRRNRIISGLSLGSLVVEAAKQSGSLITANYANEQGRQVFAIPGSIHNPLAHGCHHLIRQGAKLVETAQDVMEELASQIDLGESYLSLEKAAEKPAVKSAKTLTPTPQADDQNRLLESMGHDAVSVDELVIRTGLTPAALSSMLLVMELQGLIAPAGRGSYTRLR